MDMPANFPQASRRHFEDAELLYAEQRLANASQLYGLAAECGLKALMVGFGMPVGDKGPTNEKDRVHADKIWQRYVIYQGNHSLAPMYALSVPDPFADWSVAQRYMDDSYIGGERVAMHKSGAQLVIELVNRARLEGLLA